MCVGTIHRESDNFDNRNNNLSIYREYYSEKYSCVLQYCKIVRDWVC